jgi:hypothetical protein
MSDLLKSVVRTFVPVVVGLILSALAKLQVEVDAVGLAQLVDAIFVGLYYAVVRFLEAKNQAFGWLLGLPSPPSYDS